MEEGGTALGLESDLTDIWAGWSGEAGYPTDDPFSAPQNDLRMAAAEKANAIRSAASDDGSASVAGSVDDAGSADEGEGGKKKAKKKKVASKPRAKPLADVALGQALQGPESFFPTNGEIREREEKMAREYERRHGSSSDDFPLKDKMSRGYPMRARMRSRAVRFNKDASWYPEYEQNLMNFRPGAEVTDDEFDAHAWLGQGISKMATPMDEEEQDEFDFLKAKREANLQGDGGRSLITGY